MVPFSSITIAADGESVTCGGFSLSVPVHLGNFELIVDYFGGLSLSPRIGNEGSPFVFLMALSEEGSFDLPSLRRCRMGALPTPVTTTPWLVDILDITATQ
jgi:hypothetical protein